ncbi:MAG: GNAT family N-acetyltransferase [Elusimicrobiaceae bacterium]
MPQLFRLTADDAFFLHELSLSAGWSTTLEMWRLMLRLSLCSCYGHRSEDGTIISSSAIFKCDSLASLGMVLVRPDCRGRGLAREAVTRCLADAPRLPVMLIATEYGFPLYSKLGFKAVGQERRFTSASHTANISEPDGACRIESLEKSDFDGVCSLDEKSCGANRGEILAALAAQATKCLVLRRDSRVSGFGFCKEQAGICAIGPVTALNTEDAALLAARLISGFAVTQIDAPSGNDGLSEILTGWNFKVTESLPVMLLNAEALPGTRSNIFAIASRAFG